MKQLSLDAFDSNTITNIMTSAPAKSIDESGLSAKKFMDLANVGCDPKDKNSTRNDIYVAKRSMFLLEEGFNVRDNGFEYGIDPKKAQRYAKAYLDGKQLPPLIVSRVIVDGEPRLKVHDGHNRYGGATIAEKIDGKERILPYTLSNATDAAQEVLEMLDCGDSLALSIIDKGNGYRKLEALGWSDSSIAGYYNNDITAKDVRDAIRLSQVPAKFKEAIREELIAPSRVLKLYDSYPVKIEAEAAIELELEGNEAANSEALERGDKKSRKRHNNVYRKKTIGKKLVTNMTSAINTVTNHIAQELGYDSVESLPKDQEVIQVSLPRELLEKLLSSSDELNAIEEHNNGVDEAVRLRKEELKEQQAESK